MRNINKVIVHCSATPEGKAFSVADIRRWHLQRGFSDIGYHFVVYLDGSVHVGRPLHKSGAHCIGQNKNSVGVCYIGGVATDGKTPKDTRTDTQKASLVKLITELRQQFPNASVHGHREFTCQRGKYEADFNISECSRECTACKFANKACPCFDAHKEYNDL
mgnify:CR=1 FL=1